MKNLTDIKKTEGTNLSDDYGQSLIQHNKPLLDKHISDFLIKKTEKIVTALYMVTDYIDDGEALKNKIRATSLDLLSDVYKTTIVISNRDIYILTVNKRIDEITSFLNIAETIGLISEMNSNILKNELLIMIKDMKEFYPQKVSSTFTLDQKIFNITRPDIHKTSLMEKSYKPIGIGEYKGHIKDNNINYGMSDINNKLSFSKGQFEVNPKSSITKEERINKIILVIKDKKDLIGNENGVSIKDISSTISDYSEKTIQRELNALVIKGQLKKTGAKRWSRYQIAQSA